MPTLERKLVWDKVTRLWHWSFATCVMTGWLLGEFRDFDTVQWHFYFGYATAGLLLWRLIWGLVGPEPIRFVTLLGSLHIMGVYLSRVGSREPSGFPGHNPVGVLSIIAMLLLLTVQAASGLFVEDDTLFAAGPFAYDVSSELRSSMRSLHHLNAKLILIVVALHLGAIIFYRWWKKEDLVTPMISGMKWVKKE